MRKDERAANIVVRDKQMLKDAIRNTRALNAPMKSKELQAVAQRRKILAAEIDLSEAIDSIRKKHRLTPTDVAEMVLDYFQSCFKSIRKRKGQR